MLRFPFSPNSLSAGLRPRRLHIGPREGLSFEQKRLYFGLRQRTGEAISKIQFGRVAADCAEVAIGLTRDRLGSMSRWFSGEDVRPSALVLQFRRIRRSLDDLFNGEPCGLKMILDFQWLKEEKIHRDRMTPQFFLVSRSLAHVECKEKLATRL
jgi:hypothetical protein